MGFIGKFLVTTIAVIIAAYLLPGVHLANNYTPLIVALVLGLLNTFLKPLLVFFTLPLTIITFGLFLLVINTIIVKAASGLIGSFQVDGWGTAFLFGIIVSLIVSLLEALIGRRN